MNRSAAWFFAVLTVILIIAAAASAGSLIDRLASAHVYGLAFSAVFCALAAIAVPLLCIFFSRLPLAEQRAKGPLTGTEQIVAAAIIFALLFLLMAAGS